MYSPKEGFFLGGGGLSPIVQSDGQTLFTDKKVYHAGRNILKQILNNNNSTINDNTIASIPQRPEILQLSYEMILFKESIFSEIFKYTDKKPIQKLELFKVNWKIIHVS